MPIYEYECESCSEIFSKFLSMRDSDKAIKCPVCDKKASRNIGPTSLKTSVRSIDSIVGEDAERRWEAAYARADVQEKTEGASDATKTQKKTALKKGRV